MGILVILLIPLGVVLILNMRERAVARAAGMSEATPVCASCHYRLGGWTTSTCPECGSDVQTVGVRTGPRSSYLALAALTVVASIMIVGPLASVGTTWVFATRTGRLHGQYASSTLPRFFVTFETDYRWHRFPPGCSYETSGHLTCFDDGPVGGMWRNGRYTGPASRREKTILCTNETGPPSESVIEEAVRVVADPGIDPEVLAAHVRAVESLLGTMIDAQERGTLDARQVIAWSDGPLSNPGTGGGGISGGASITAFIVTTAIVILCGWIGIRLARRWGRAGWRAPRDDEWIRASTELRSH